MSLLRDALQAVIELRDLHRQTLKELRAIKLSVQAQRPMLTVAQARRALQVSDDAADAILKRLNVIHIIDGREVVFLDELVAARRLSSDQSRQVHTPTDMVRRAPRSHARRAS